MRLNYELARKLLVFIQEAKDEQVHIHSDSNSSQKIFQGFTNNEVIEEGIALLNSGLIDAWTSRTNGEVALLVINGLTGQGHNFLNSV